VGTEVGGIPEIIENGTNGVLVKPEPKDIAAGIGYVLKKPGLRSELIENARKKLKDYFTWPRAHKQWLALYTEALR
jgi:glycosyltransferase involved in cell wall biosynthesis